MTQFLLPALPPLPSALASQSQQPASLRFVLAWSVLLPLSHLSANTSRTRWPPLRPLCGSSQAQAQHGPQRTEWLRPRSTCPSGCRYRRAERCTGTALARGLRLPQSCQLSWGRGCGAGGWQVLEGLQNAPQSGGSASVPLGINPLISLSERNLTTGGSTLLIQSPQAWSSKALPSSSPASSGQPGIRNCFQCHPCWRLHQFCLASRCGQQMGAVSLHRTVCKQEAGRRPGFVFCAVKTGSDLLLCSPYFHVSF